MKLKELFNPSGHNGFIEAVYEIKPFNETWYTELIASDLNVALDNYILINSGNRNVSQLFEKNVNTYKTISDILSANAYKLNGLFASINFEYNPLDNYDRTETQTANASTTVGERTSSDTIGQSSSTSATSDNRSTFEDNAGYQTPTDKSSTTVTSNGQTNSHTEQSATDSTNSGYTLRARGNIGVMSTMELIERQRAILNYNFFDAVLMVINENITDFNFED